MAKGRDDDSVAEDEEPAPPDTTDGDAKLLGRFEEESLSQLDKFFFAVVSAKRPGNVSAMEARLVGCAPTWFVAEGDGEAYRAAGASQVVESGALCRSRNAALEAAFRDGKTCVQLSDDIVHVKFINSDFDAVGKAWRKPGSLSEANDRAKKAETRFVGFEAAAKFIDATCRRRRCYLGGTFPCGNPGQACAASFVAEQHFVVGDFFVALPSEPRFDEDMTLKEDYDFTAQHVHKYGKVARVNRLTLLAQHYSNAGGAVAIRNVSREKQNIKHLRKKWPGVFGNSPRGDTEVRMRWACRDVTLGGTRIFEPDPKAPGRAIYDQDKARLARDLRLKKEALKEEKKKLKDRREGLLGNNEGFGGNEGGGNVETKHDDGDDDDDDEENPGLESGGVEEVAEEETKKKKKRPRDEDLINDYDPSLRRSSRLRYLYKA